jgi:arginyl-tRNA synthetase
MSLISQLSERFGAAFASLGIDPSHGGVVVSQRPDLAQYQCNGALPAAREAGQDPRALAAAVIAALGDVPEIADLSVAGPGFINVTVTDAHLGTTVAATAGDERFGVSLPATPQRVLIDYGGPNMSKSMHVGHLRASIIGESLKRLFRFAGHDTWGDVHAGDWGMPIGQLIIELQRRRPDLPYFDAAFTGPYPAESPVTLDDLSEMYPVVVARCQADPEESERARQATFDLQNGRPGTWHSGATSTTSRSPSNARTSRHSASNSTCGTGRAPSRTASPRWWQTWWPAASRSLPTEPSSST